MNNTQRVAIVTGAGSGIGRATAEMLGECGFAVVLAGRTRETLEATAESVPGETLVLPADVGTETGARAIVEGAAGAFGRLDVLVNNAAVAPCKPFAEFGWAELERMYRVNSIGPMALIAAAWPVFAAQHAAQPTTGNPEHRPPEGHDNIARIVNLSSMATLDPFPGLAAYAASKAAVNLLTRACANEGADAGIKAFAVAPGAVETAMLRSIASEDVLPRNMTLNPKQVASVILACACGERDEENGSVILVPSPA
ncbi:MAG: SDR family oxidoreductase [Planctomycetota bacterium]|nr:SDR family oxidoreductase [Planctomycetota bacterium]